MFVARQPIFDGRARVVGYELLYRASLEADACRAPADEASARVFTDALLAFGLDSLAPGAPAFLNLTRRWLLEGVAELLPVDRVVIEIPETVLPDEQVLTACRLLRRAGYVLALDDFVDASGYEPLLDLVQIVKVDVLATTETERRALVKRLAPRGLTLVAEKIETPEAHAAAKADGFQWFQGFFFARPSTRTVRDIPARRLSYLRLIQAFANPELTVGELEDLVQHDVSLCYRLLRTINSAAFGMHAEVSSIRQAIVLLGLQTIRRWACLWAIAGLAEGKSRALVALGLMRAQSCGHLGHQRWGADVGAELFLVGMLSLVDVILERPMAEIVGTLPLSEAACAALEGRPGPWRSLLETVIAYERGDWADAERLAMTCELTLEDVMSAYAEALRWSRSVATVVDEPAN